MMLCRKTEKGKQKESVMKELYAKQPKKEKSHWREALGYTLMTVLVLGAVVYFCGAFYFRDKFFTGTTINYIDASYAKVDEMEQEVKERVENYRLLIKERGGEEEYIEGEEIGYQYVSTGELKTFKKEQNPFFWPSMLVKNHHYTFASSAVYDAGMLQEEVASLNCLDPAVEQEPKDAVVVFNGMNYELHREVQGKKIDRNQLDQKVKTAVETGAEVLNLERSGCYQAPKVTADNKELQKKYQQLDCFTRTRIEYDFDTEKEILDGSTIHDWIFEDENGDMAVSEDAIAQYVYELAEKYNTHDKGRHFETNDGSFVDVWGGSYGWMIDQTAETEALKELISKGEQIKREPVYYQTPSSETRENCDMGDSYIEIDLTRQHLWMYRDGITIVESDFVSGNMAKQHGTPGGTYELYWKESPSVLKSTEPGDSYETPVTYWMPFNGGIGLHDAPWRGAFGGNIYQTGGSHGCINLPSWAAKEIYENIDAGYPIICYYR